MVEMNLFAKQKQSLSCRDQICGYQRKKWGWDELGDWDYICTLPCLKELTNENLLRTYCI